MRGCQGVARMSQDPFDSRCLRCVAPSKPPKTSAWATSRCPRVGDAGLHSRRTGAITGPSSAVSPSRTQNAQVQVDIQYLESLREDYISTALAVHWVPTGLVLTQ
jgi:hypothetical protein